MTDKSIDLRARVFISCGQTKGTDEIAIAEQIAEQLRHLGFEPYIAVEEQTLLGLRENIFQRLRNSEYLIFIDFKRERLPRKGKITLHRGSLFSHQELAIASYLEIEAMAAQEMGVKADDGMLSILQLNAVPFTNRDELPAIIGRLISERRWDPNWRNELVLERTPQENTDASLMNLEGTKARFFHIAVRNHHKEQTATHCYIHFEKATRIDQAQKTEIPLKTVEFKWAGTALPNVGISPRTARDFDAFFLLHDTPTVLHFNAFVDSSEYVPRIAGAGEYRLSYLVTAETFPPARGTFTLLLNNSLDQTIFR